MKVPTPYKVCLKCWTYIHKDDKICKCKGRRFKTLYVEQEEVKQEEPQEQQKPQEQKPEVKEEIGETIVFD